MSLLTDSQLDYWLNEWAKWCRGGKGVAALGYPTHSIDQAFVQSNSRPGTMVFNNDIQAKIESAVSVLAQRDRRLADVGRYEYGASDRVGHPDYDGPRQERNARELGMSLSTYKRKLADFRLAVHTTLSVVMQPMDHAA